VGVAIPLRELKQLSQISEPDKWAEFVKKKIGNAIPTLTLNNVLCAVYIGHENLSEVKTPSGVIIPIIKTDDQIKEDIWQGKMNLVIACGPAVFVDDPSMKFYGQQIRPGDWVSFPNHTCTQMEVGKIPCRLVQDRFINSVWADPRHLTS
jgi:hypothetical protein